MSIRFNERGTARKDVIKSRDRRISNLDKFLARNKPRNLVETHTDVPDTLLAVSPLGAAFNNTRESSIREIETRFIPHKAEYDLDLDCWVGAPKPDPTDYTSPRHSSAVPRQMQGPYFEVRHWRSRQLYWRFKAPNRHLALDEAAILARLAGYDFRKLEVRRV